MARRTYNMVLMVNGRLINEIVIDPHYEKKHSDIDDTLILELVRKLDGREFAASERVGEFEFFMLDRIQHGEKLYRLVWCMHDHSMYIGVINAFRRSK